MTESGNNPANSLADLGPGPMRFALVGERSIQEQVDSLNEQERLCFDNLKAKWQAENPDQPFGDAMYLRFSRCSPGPVKFNEKASYKVMKKFDRRYLVLKMSSLEAAFSRKLGLPVPGLKTKTGFDVLYFPLAKYFPKETTTQEITDVVAYSLGAMVDKEHACTEGVAVIADMKDWTLANFQFTGLVQFMKMLQGRVPCRIRSIFMVNAHGMFEKMWSVISPLMNPYLRSKIKFLSEDKLPEYLSEGCKALLPDLLKIGEASADDMVRDFIVYRKAVEAD